ncbi:hypothetical protein, partial [uncultured Prevotella sp.]|uniref:hypothetical protein n=1 Tax=uncultured Prevotella sp. TaxID=159272 RepID=UPI0025928C84
CWTSKVRNEKRLKFLTAYLGSFSKENCLDKEEFSFLNNPANICFDKLNFNDNNIPLSYRINHPGAIQRRHQYYPMIKAIDIIIKDL